MTEVNTEEARRQSPCLTCARVKDPQDCENKLCKEWQAWFIARWDSMRASVRGSMHQRVTVEDAIGVGGCKYSHPDRMRAHLACNPCAKCVCPTALCDTPCAVRKAWDELRSEVKQ